MYSRKEKGMGGESKLNQHLKTLLSDYAEMSRLESPLTNQGISDWMMSFRLGPRVLVEAKHMVAWPKRPETPINLRHYTKEQQRFLYSHGKASGRAFTILQIEKDIMVFSWRQAYQIDRKTQGELLKSCVFKRRQDDRSHRSKYFRESLVDVLTTYDGLLK
jgi:hypothetical protein